MEKIIATFATAALLAGLPAHGAIVFSDDFESPDVTGAQSDGNTSGAIDTAKWVKANQGFGSGRQGTVDESHGDFTDPVGEQGYAFRYTNSGITSQTGVIGALTAGETYTVTFDVVLDGHNNTTPYNAMLVTFNGGNRNDTRGGGTTGTTSTLATVSSPSDGLGGNITVNTTYQTVTLTYTSDGTEAELGHDVAVRFIGATSSAIIDNVSVDVLIPEPGSLALLGLGGLMVGYRRRRD